MGKNTRKLHRAIKSSPYIPSSTSIRILIVLSIVNIMFLVLSVTGKSKQENAEENNLERLKNFSVDQFNKLNLADKAFNFISTPETDVPGYDDNYNFAYSKPIIKSRPKLPLKGPKNAPKFGKKIPQGKKQPKTGPKNGMKLGKKVPGKKMPGPKVGKNPKMPAKNTPIPNVIQPKVKPNNENKVFIDGIQSPTGFKNIKNLVFHNKFPKAGSTTFLQLLMLLSKQNNFFLLNFNNEDKQNNDEVVETLRKLDNNPLDIPETGNVMVIKHHFWFNFTRLYGIPQPRMINIIRDPVDWYRSNYNFCRHGWEKNDKYRGTGCKSLTEEQLNLSFEDCVVEDRDECMKGPVNYLNWLCGDKVACGKVAALKLTKAKWNVEKNYQVIGLLERMEDTLKLLEVEMPGYFNGALQLYHSESIQKASSQSKTINKGSQSIPMAVRDKVVDKKLGAEMKLYEFAVTLFEKKFKSTL